MRASVSAVDGVVYFQPGELLVGAPTLAGRPALRPLRGEDSVVLPEDLSDYEVLSADCPDGPATRVAERDRGDEPVDPSDRVLTRGDIGGDGQLEEVLVERPAPTLSPVVKVLRGELLVAEGTLPVPAQPCRGLVAEAEPDADPALLLIWTSGAGANNTVGITVFELPEEAGD